MNDEQEEGSSASSTSSSTRLPISTGLDNYKYSFSSFPSSSPALSSQGSSDSSTDKLFDSSKTQETAAVLRFSLEHSRGGAKIADEEQNIRRDILHIIIQYSLYIL